MSRLRRLQQRARHRSAVAHALQSYRRHVWHQRLRRFCHWFLYTHRGYIPGEPFQTDLDVVVDALRLYVDWYPRHRYPFVWFVRRVMELA